MSLCGRDSTQEEHSSNYDGERFLQCEKRSHCGSLLRIILNPLRQQAIPG
jgi:hypothetical protein